MSRHSHRLLILGRGPKEDALKAMAAELGIADRLLMPGQDDNPWRLRRDVLFLQILRRGFDL